MQTSFRYGLIPVVLVSKDEPDAAKLAQKARGESCLIEHDSVFEIIVFHGWPEDLWKRACRETN